MILHINRHREYGRGWRRAQRGLPHPFVSGPVEKLVFAGLAVGGAFSLTCLLTDGGAGLVWMLTTAAQRIAEVLGWI